MAGPIVPHLPPLMRTLLPLLFLVPLVASAQPTVGLKAGLNVSNVYGADDELNEDGFDKSAVLGFVGGLLVDFPLSPSFGVRAEALYAQKGFKVYGEDTIGGERFELDVDYSVDFIEIPVLARVAIPVGPFSEAGLLLGPAVAFKVSESVDVDARVNGEDIPGFDDDFFDDGDEDLFESFDLGAVLGAEYGSGPFAVDLRYTYGLLDANRNVEEDPAAPTLRHGVFSVTGAFRFGR